MPNVKLMLGPVSFQDFELPADINFGGKQVLAVHQLANGQRVIDTMGPSESDIVFHGIFSGPTAAVRARLLDSFRTSGAPLGLTWESFCYSVVVSQFDANFKNPTWIPYRLSCSVVSDQAMPPDRSSPSLLNAISADLTTASQIYSDTDIGFSNLIKALSDPNAQAKGASGQASIQKMLLGLQNEIQTRDTSAENTLDNMQSMNAEPVRLVASDICALIAAAQQVAELTNVSGYVGKAMKVLISTGA